MSGSPRVLGPIAALLCLAGSAPVSAADIVAEIDQRAALAGGVTPGDAAGFPVTLTRPGLYRLGGPLEVADARGAIRIEAGDVTVDLRGFALEGPGRCREGASACGSATTAAGVSGPSGAAGVRVQNGTVRGFGGDGIRLLGPGARVENVRARDNGGDGIHLGFYARVSGSTAERNGGDGIEISNYSSAWANVVRLNGESGIDAGSACKVSRNAALRNEDGIQAADGSTVISNRVSENASYGLSLNAAAAYASNVISSNNGNSAGWQLRPEVAGGVQVGSNLCGTDTICP